MKNVVKNVIAKMQKILAEEELKILEITLENELLRKQAKEKKNNEQLLDEFIKSKVYENCSQETIAQYKRENLRFLGKIHKKVENVDKKDIEKYLADYREERKVSERTLNNARAFISAFFNYLEFEDIIKCNPVRKTKPIREVKKVRHSFSDLQIEQMRECAKTDRDRAIIETLNTTGVRVSELHNLDISDIKQGKARQLLGARGTKRELFTFQKKPCITSTNILIHEKTITMRYLSILGKPMANMSACQRVA